MCFTRSKSIDLWDFLIDTNVLDIGLSRNLVMKSDENT